MERDSFQEGVSTNSTATSPGNDDYLAVARVVAAHGIRGEVRCEVITDFPERFRSTKRLFLGAAHTPVDVERARSQKGGLLLKFADVDTRNAAERLRGVTLSIPGTEAVALPPGSFFWHDIIGLRVLTTAGDDLGQVAEILQTGGNDVYVVKRGDAELLIPAIKDVVRDVDLGAGVMTVELMEGLE
ncbi:MAG: ribosome maturation factor RimM [Chloroflexi bacterium]|nr:ribosome maturation factor RimM [Chloroflexota bacterium]